MTGRQTHNLLRRGAALVLGAVLLLGAAGCAGAEKEYASKEDFASARLGTFPGGPLEEITRREFPGAEVSYYPALSDLTLALHTGKLDGFVMDKAFYRGIAWERDDLTYLDQTLERMDYAYLFAKSDAGRALKGEMDEFLQSCRESGELEQLQAKWFADTEPEGAVDLSGLTGENGTLRLAAGSDNKPFIYRKNNEYTGYEIELAARFAEEYGYALEISEVHFDGTLMGVAAGKYDMGAFAVTPTEERAEELLFSEPTYTGEMVLVIRGEGQTGGQATKTLADFQTGVIGVHAGSVYDDFAKRDFPEAERAYYSLMSDMILAVEQGKVDGYISEKTYVTAAIWEGAGILPIEEPIDQSHAGYIFPKGETSARLRGQINEFLRAARESGRLKELQDKWLAPVEPDGELDYASLTGENGTIRVAVAPDLKPISYIKNGELTGYEMEMLVDFAREYGYDLELSMMTFDSVLPGITTGRYDIGTGAITITEERAQSVDFSDSHITVDVVMVVAADQTAGEAGFWEELRTNFEKTFIREDRWKLIAEGLGVTVLISLCSMAAGTLLGFGLYLLARSEKAVIRGTVRGIARVYARIVAGTPAVVILMILFYIVFGSVRDISGIPVAIIGFSLTFGAFVYDHMTLSVSSVDRGQTEGAYALGYSRNRTFLRIVLPQAMTVFLPTYCGQAVELIKATAVVGYVAVNDLTKMGDIIRSNTYEAFFPLLSTAAIYFLLTWALALLLGRVRRRFEPKRRGKEQILKGIRTEG